MKMINWSKIHKVILILMITCSAICISEFRYVTAVQNQITLTKVSEITARRTTDVHVSNDTLYVLNADSGLGIYNIINNSNPDFLGRVYYSYTFTHNMVVDKQIAYIADYYDGL